MEAAVESSVFGARPGNVVGPFKLEDGWHLIKIESLHRADLDDALRKTIKAEVFAEWFEERLRKARIKIPLLEVIAPVTESEDLAVLNE
jgi:parvulin-like peptidyl-prolyl isomerase